MTDVMVVECQVGTLKSSSILFVCKSPRGRIVVLEADYKFIEGAVADKG